MKNGRHLQFLERRMRNYGRKNCFYLMLLVLALIFLVVVPVNAHGGEGEHVDGPVSAWMVGTIYIQLLMAPFVGIWLVNEALDAWLLQRSEQTEGDQDDTTGEPSLDGSR